MTPGSGREILVSYQKGTGGSSPTDKATGTLKETAHLHLGTRSTMFASLPPFPLYDVLRHTLHKTTKTSSVRNMQNDKSNLLFYLMSNNLHVI
jgi:hypothetical protein